MNFAINLPVNPTSFGNIGISLLREFYKRNLSPPIFIIANGDLNGQKPDQDFAQWLQTCANKAFKVHSRDNPTVKLWHCSHDSLASFSKEEIFITFIETDQLTDIEVNILRNKKTVFVTSNFLKKVCEEYGLTNVKYLQLGFDSYNFKRKEKKYHDDGRISHLLTGKWETRKHHEKIIRAWAKKYGCPKTGVKPKHFLQCAVHNPFLVQNINGQMIDRNLEFYRKALDGKEYSNIDFYNWMPDNESYNDFLNSGDIIIGMSGGENCGLPEMHTVGLGKHSVILRANGYADWATDENSVLVEPNSKIVADDGMFFKPGNAFQQGNFFSFDDDVFISKLEESVKRYEKNPLNVAGLELQKRTYKETVDQLLKEI